MFNNIYSAFSCFFSFSPLMLYYFMIKLMFEIEYRH